MFYECGTSHHTILCLFDLETQVRHRQSHPRLGRRVMVGNDGKWSSFWGFGHTFLCPEISRWADFVIIIA